MKKKEDMYRYAAKPGKGSSMLFPATAGVYYDFEEKRAVSTDGHILRISKAAYDAQYEKEGIPGVSIGRDGKEIEGKFPKFRSVIPYFGKKKRVESLDKRAILDSIKQAKAKAKQEGVVFDMLLVYIPAMWMGEMHLKMALDIIDEMILSTNPLHNKYLYGEKDGEEILIARHGGPDPDIVGYDAKFAFYKKGCLVYWV